MQTACDSLIQLADDPKHLGARVGILAVLHTWANNLTYHPHVHLLVTGGGVDAQGQWVDCKSKYLVPVKALSKLIRGKLAARLKKDYPDLHQLVAADTWKKDWVVHSIHYQQGSTAVLNYLGRYVFRIAITNNRILSMSQTHVTFKYKDRQANKWKIIKLEGCEFLRRFLQHVLPSGFHKVRYYGLWHHSRQKLAESARLLLMLSKSLDDGPTTVSELIKAMALSADDASDPMFGDSDTDSASSAMPRCPHCGSERTAFLGEVFGER